jgi:Zn-dependent peptidase ImmA (M78 family)
MNNTLIEEMADNLLKKAGAYEVEVKLEKCVEYLGLTVSDVDLEDTISGFIGIKNNTAQIGVNSLQSDVRKRFTIAHEIGHYTLHRDTKPLFIDKINEANELLYFRDLNSSKGELVKEREANTFAAALLMPKQLLETQIEIYYKEQNRDIDLIEYLAKLFNVSTHAMSIRLTKIGFLDYIFGKDLPF